MIIIPARLDSTRFPRKILAPIQGVPMVVATARNAQKVDETIVACDSQEVLEICQKHNIKAILTDTTHTSGTDRCAQAAKKLNLPPDAIIINVQADEPFLETSVIALLKEKMRHAPFMGTCAKAIDTTQIANPNLVKVVCARSFEAIYFSRLPIPYSRDGLENPLLKDHPYYGHIGIYGFHTQSLEEFCSLEKSPLEDIEKLEQLRAIYHQKPIFVCITESKSIGIDTPEDLQNALKSTLQTPQNGSHGSH
ncbi:3-deoxy-D-manno-octulosonate cytidylyltransferase [Helicobacter sp. 12S02634-8]|uniref:3-deoxy-manno-octulosonate cytidylyltransferase n=1 Tax=Helicobacter sp. 12S02634-8 TaxID=1476199 RepID=UPI000BA51A6E|nr:3-deoxy-manno-octulosonate cytidylyltransferase [Helicobacter sp. 12S02634-8]PAF47319.1 3-deoxy-D-manno-octulosonate cytidylyltransferase [Helicobacter sp. 12S02634-8]